MLFVFAVQVVFAAFTNTISGKSTDKTRTTYSLKNINKFKTKAFSLNSAKYSFHLKPTELTTQQTPVGFVTGSNIQFSKGNTTYIFPYKVKLKVPKFKAPSPTN